MCLYTPYMLNKSCLKKEYMWYLFSSIILDVPLRNGLPGCIIFFFAHHFRISIILALTPFSAPKPFYFIIKTPWILYLIPHSPVVAVAPFRLVQFAIHRHFSRVVSSPEAQFTLTRSLPVCVLLTRSVPVYVQLTRSKSSSRSRSYSQKTGHDDPPHPLSSPFIDFVQTYLKRLH